MTADQANKTPAAAEGRGTQHTEAQKRENDAAQRGADKTVAAQDAEYAVGSGKRTMGASRADRVVARRSKESNAADDATNAFQYPEGKTAADYRPENYKEGPEYPEGEAAAGKLDYEKIAESEQPMQQIPMRDRRAYLLDQAEKNQAANDDLNAKQVEASNRFRQGLAFVNDPDLQRDMSMENAEEELDRHTPEAVENFRKTRAEILAKQRGEAVPVESATK